MNRLFELLLLLLDSEKLTAKELATHFEVSSRTIFRDIDKLIVAGIPIETVQGYDGGISICKSYRLSNSFIDVHEKESILAGLKALDSISKNSISSFVTQKIFLERPEQPMVIDIDLSSWYGESIIPKIDLIKNAILNQLMIRFDYYSKKGCSNRTICPQKLVFRHGNWYLSGVEKNTDIYKLFKLTRMDSIVTFYEPSSLPETPKQDDYFDDYFAQENYHLIAEFDPSVKFKLIDVYGIDSFYETSDGLHFERDFANKEYLLSWLLSFGPFVTVYEPAEIKKELINCIKKMSLLY